MNNELERMWKEIVMALNEELFQDLSGRNQQESYILYVNQACI
jgi:hypothetical protein